MTLAVPSGIGVGTYPFTVEVLSGPAAASAGFTLNITDFSLQPPSAASDWAPPGGAMNVSLSVLPLGSFNGTVNVTCTLDGGGTCTGGSFSIGGTAPNPINVAASWPSDVSGGTPYLTVHAPD